MSHKGGDDMNQADRLPREIEALHSRLSRLSRASLRITEDLDLGIALQEMSRRVAEAMCCSNGQAHTRVRFRAGATLSQVARE